jgi:hypothetical protein
LLRCDKPSPAFCFGNFPVVLFAELHIYNTVVLGNDTDTAHLAAAMECPTLVISRHPANGDPNHANSPARFGPRCARSRVLQPLSGAGNCSQSCRSREAHCILQVRVDRVVAAALELLPEGRRASAEKTPAAFNGIAVQAVDDLQLTQEMVSC